MSKKFHKFKTFHPYLTYSSGKKYFISSEGTPSFEGWRARSDGTEMSDDAINLWRLGKKAYGAMIDNGGGIIADKAHFDEIYGYHLAMVDAMRDSIKKGLQCVPGSIIFKGPEGEILQPDIEELSDLTLVDIYWKSAQRAPSEVPSEVYSFLAGAFLFVCFEAIDDAVFKMCLDEAGVNEGGAAASALEAAEAFANFQAIVSDDQNLQKARSELGLRAALERYKNDPKQLEKAFVKDCWDGWQKHPSRYKTQTAFANDMLKKVSTNERDEPIISFDTIVKKWIPEWTPKKKK